MTKTISVSIDTSVTPPVLQLQHYGHVHVDKEPAAQTINWKLHGALAQGQFSPSGFRWLPDGPPPGIFGEPEPAANRKSLSMTDLHPDGRSDGDWAYELSVEFEGKTYTCPAKTGAGSVAKTASAAILLRDPIIINH